MDADQMEFLLRRFEMVRPKWQEVPPSEVLRQRASWLVSRHVLRAADALQLAGAMEWRGESRHDATFISGDLRLLDAARAEGFVIRSTA